MNDFKTIANLSLQYHLTRKDMQKKILWIGLILVLSSSLQVKAQYAKQDSTYKRWFLRTSLFVLLGNLDTENPPNFAQLSIGYRITGKDAITLTPKTWKYAWPNGIHPFLNKAYKKPAENFWDMFVSLA